MLSIKNPTLIVNRAIASRNIDRMLEKARQSDVIFRPHFKTHQSEEIAQLFREKRVDKITVSSVKMAQFFAFRGWHNITIAFPFNVLEMETVNQLASQIKLNILVESTLVADQLAGQAKAELGVFIKIDTGYHRTGLLPSQVIETESVLNTLEHSSFLHFKGFLTHAGHTYHARGRQEIMQIKASALANLQQLKEKYKSRFPDLKISYGDTPSCSQAADCKGFDEIRPGNFVYFDVMQYHLGSCSPADIAVAVACPVMATHPEREEAVVYGGAVHLSKEFIAADDNFRLYGYIVKLNRDGSWGTPVNGAYVSSLSQEHGIVKLPKNELKNLKPGDLLGVLPVHSCLTANLLKDETHFI